MRKKLVAGNWKMNVLPSEAAALINSITSQIPSLASHQMVAFCVPSLAIAASKQAMPSQSNILLGAQNFYPKDNGAFTGEVSLPMLLDAGVQTVLIGHSERRGYFGESNAFLKEKVDATLQANMLPIFCCGEPLEIREANTEVEFVSTQIQDSLFHLSATDFQKVVIAYEPIWAIGTGKTASTEQAQQMHAAIRSKIAEQYGAEVADEITILYGGSCNASNAAELFSQPDVDGGLIGGAALKADTFLPIILAMK
jgi:triosephosphate isomerase (TIM)